MDKIHKTLSSPNAVDHLTDYFNEDSDKPLYSGRKFHTLGGRAGHDDNAITPYDLLALATLSVPAPGSAVIKVLEDSKLREQISEYLGAIPANASIAGELQQPEYLKRDKSPLYDLWQLIKGIPGFGPVSTSKLLARKRPHLVPVFDSIIEGALGLRSDKDHWQVMIDIFKEHQTRLGDLRTEAGLAEKVSLLRVFDIVVWMEHRPKKASK